MECGFTLYEHDGALLIGHRVVPHPFGDYKHLALVEVNRTVSQLNAKATLENVCPKPGKSSVMRRKRSAKTNFRNRSLRVGIWPTDRSL